MFNLVIFASGNGSTMQAIIDSIRSGELDANINLVVSDNSEAYVLERAKNYNIPTYILKSTTFLERDDELTAELAKYDIDLIVLARIS